MSDFSQKPKKIHPNAFQTKGVFLLLDKLKVIGYNTSTQIPDLGGTMKTLIKILFEVLKLVVSSLFIWLLHQVSTIGLAEISWSIFGLDVSVKSYFWVVAVAGILFYVLQLIFNHLIRFVCQWLTKYIASPLLILGIMVTANIVAARTIIMLSLFGITGTENWWWAGELLVFVYVVIQQSLVFEYSKKSTITLISW